MAHELTIRSTSPKKQPPPSPFWTGGDTQMIEQLVVTATGYLFSGRPFVRLGPYHSTLYAEKRGTCQIHVRTECPPKPLLLRGQLKPTRSFKGAEPTFGDSVTVATRASKFHNTVTRLNALIEAYLTLEPNLWISQKAGQVSKA
jgi:hypothetical protein